MGSSSVLRRDLKGYSGDDDDHVLLLQLHRDDLLSDDIHHHDKGQAKQVQPDGRVVGVQQREELGQGNQHDWQRRNELLVWGSGLELSILYRRRM
jgi:hypothetical protein